MVIFLLLNINGMLQHLALLSCFSIVALHADHIFYLKHNSYYYLNNALKLHWAVQFNRLNQKLTCLTFSLILVIPQSGWINSYVIVQSKLRFIFIISGWHAYFWIAFVPIIVSIFIIFVFFWLFSSFKFMFLFSNFRLVSKPFI